MGIGRLNPGCLCGCRPRVTIDDPCRRAGQFWRPSSVTLSCQSFGGIAASSCSVAEMFDCTDPMKANPSSGSLAIPPFDDPNFSCFYGIGSVADYQTGVWSPGNPISECWGMWPIWQSAGCVIGFSNFYRLGASLNLYSFPYFVGGSVSIGYNPTTGVGTLTARIQVSAVLFSGIGYLGNFDACGAAPKQGPNWGESGLNWLAAGAPGSPPSLQAGWAVEVNGPPVRSSTFKKQFAAAYGLPGAPGTFPYWCTYGHAYYGISAESNYVIQTNDPTYGSMRSFPLWTPNPALDELGITIDASISIATAV